MRARLGSRARRGGEAGLGGVGGSLRLGRLGRQQCHVAQRRLRREPLCRTPSQKPPRQIKQIGVEPQSVESVQLATKTIGKFGFATARLPHRLQQAGKRVVARHRSRELCQATALREASELKRRNHLPHAPAFRRVVRRAATPAARVVRFSLRGSDTMLRQRVCNLQAAHDIGRLIAVTELEGGRGAVGEGEGIGRGKQQLENHNPSRP
mmetsp:Transcript_16841/g.37779  ORF Transcript_16841/g.37779 Transcript_16841/m.37779 type:complete len:209 (-) Transcript_16841:201-827(-)